MPGGALSLWRTCGLTPWWRPYTLPILRCFAQRRRGKTGRAVFYIEGDYQEKDRLEAEPFGAQDALPEDMEPPAFRRQALTERWKLSIPDNGEQTHTLRYLPPEESSRLWLYLHTGAGWSQVQAREIGRYLVFPVTGNDIELAVCTVYLAPWVWALAAALSVFLLAMAVPRAAAPVQKRSQGAHGAALLLIREHAACANCAGRGADEEK